MSMVKKMIDINSITNKIANQNGHVFQVVLTPKQHEIVSKLSQKKYKKLMILLQDHVPFDHALSLITN